MTAHAVRIAIDSLGTPEGHTVRCNAAGDVIGVMLAGGLTAAGKMTITIPERIDVSAEALAPAMASPAA